GAEEILEDLDSAKDWELEPTSSPSGLPSISTVAIDQPKTEGNHAQRVTYNIGNDDGTVLYFKKRYFPYVEVDNPIALKVDIFPESQTTKSYEPIRAMILNKDLRAEGTLYHDHIPRLDANRWNEVRIDLTENDL